MYLGNMELLTVASVCVILMCVNCNGDEMTMDLNGVEDRKMEAPMNISGAEKRWEQYYRWIPSKYSWC